jgi:hypothetical protein
LAVFSLIVCLMLLAGMGLLSVEPWGSDSVEPQVRVSPGIGAAVDDSVAVAAAPLPRVADARIAAGDSHERRTRIEEPVAVPGGDVSVPVLAVSEGRPVTDADLVSAPPQSSEPLSPLPGPAAAPPPPPAPPAPPAPAPPALPVSPPALAPRFVADFENGLQGWSTSSMGDAVPRVGFGIARDGSRSGVVRLFDGQSRSQLILGGDGGDSEAGALQIREGDEYAFAFSFYIETIVYAAPGVDNLLMQFKSDASDSQTLGLQLWDAGDGIGRGLWSSGDAVSGNRFLAAVPERVWHDAIVHFGASSQGAGFYEVYLDGQLIDARSGVSLIAPGSSHAQIEVGLSRDGERVRGTSEIRIDAAKLGESLESVLP